MPLYTDPYYYGSSGGYQSYSPYYTSNPYSSFGNYNRALAGTYVVPVSRTSYTPSRYKPNLTTITESPLSSRHSAYTSLTRIQSPKIAYHTSPKYTPPRPIPINTADIDVSATRYRKYEKTPEKDLKIVETKKSNTETKPEVKSDLNNNNDNNNNNNNSVEEKSPFMPRIDGTDPGKNRSTIKRGRHVVRLSTMRPKTKDNQQANNEKDSKDSKEVKTIQTKTHLKNPENELQKSKSWRDKFGDDLAPKSNVQRKTPGELLLERHIIRDRDRQKETELELSDLSKPLNLMPPANGDETTIQVIDSDGLRRYSISQCPSFHEICADISSDKIDDDLNAGELRRRASLIQEQELELLNQLQKSGSGTFHYILERNVSQDDCSTNSSHKSKRKSKKGKKVRHKITGTVNIDKPIEILPELAENISPAITPILKTPKIIFSVDEVDEDHTIHKVFKLPKKKVKSTKSDESEKLHIDNINGEVKSPTPSTTSSEMIFSSSQDDDKNLPTVVQHFTLAMPKKKKKTKDESQDVKTKDTKRKSVEKVSESIDKSSSIKWKSIGDSPIFTVQHSDKSVKSPTPEHFTFDLPNENEISVKEPESASIWDQAPETPVVTIKLKSPKPEKRKPSKPSPSDIKMENMNVKTSKLKEKILKSPKSGKLLIIEPQPASPTPLIAKPKPIVKLQKSESGEDFWSQIGSRETMYMNNRKKSLLGKQWEKREHLLLEKCDNENFDELKTKLNSEKSMEFEEVKKSNNIDHDIKRSESNDSALSQVKDSSIDIQKDSNLEKDRKKLTSVETNKSSTNLTSKLRETKEKSKSSLKTTMEKLSDTSSMDAKSLNCDKKIDLNKSNENSQFSDKFTKLPLSHAQQDKNQNVEVGEVSQDRTSLPKTAAIESFKEDIVRISFGEMPSNTITTITTSKPITPTLTTIPETTGTATKKFGSKINTGLEAKSPETKLKEKISNKNAKDQNDNTTAAAKGKSENAIKLKDEKKIVKKKKSEIVDKTLSIKSKEEKSSGSIEIGKTTSTTSSETSDQNLEKQNDNSRISEIKKIGSSSLKENKKNSSSKKSPERLNKQRPQENDDVGKGVNHQYEDQQHGEQDQQHESNKNVYKTNTNNLQNEISTRNDSNRIIENNNNIVEENSQIPKTIKKDDIFTTSSDQILSKFATVSNLNRCLLDVDADLSDYIPSSSSEDDSSYEDGSSGDSMKKKVRDRKKKDNSENKFDPNKKVKLDHKKKCYVKEEAPRYPLIATPRPLWKREKHNYPKDSDSESDETDSDSECSTSDEYSDDLIQKQKDGSSSSGGGAITSLGCDIRLSTCSNDSGFEGGTAPSSPKRMLETSHTFAQFQRSGRITAPATTIPRFKKYAVDDFHFLAVLGKGSFGKVLLAELRNTEYYYAVKCLKKDVVLEDDDVECTLIERKVLALGTKHPYLCHLFCTFQTESHLFFVMEYLNGGDLMFHIQQSGRFPEPRARFYAAEIISGLKFLHKKGIIYRDLKLDNVLLDFDGHVRIADFGMCKLQIYLDKTADSFCGTPDYMAPEIIKGEKYNQNVDWWSFGVLLYEMLIGQSPFSGCDEDELFWSICNEIPWFPVYITQEGMSLLKGLLEKSSNARIGSHYSPAGDICDHVFFRDIDWGRLERRQIDPPFKPQVKHPLDTQYFDKAFTRERVRLTPIDKDILHSMDQAQFQGFSYTNPNATLN